MDPPAKGYPLCLRGGLKGGTAPFYRKRSFRIPSIAAMLCLPSNGGLGANAIAPIKSR